MEKLSKGEKIELCVKINKDLKKLKNASYIKPINLNCLMDYTDLISTLQDRDYVKLADKIITLQSELTEKISEIITKTNELQDMIDYLS